MWKSTKIAFTRFGDHGDEINDRSVDMSSSLVYRPVDAIDARSAVDTRWTDALVNCREAQVVVEAGRTATDERVRQVYAGAPVVAGRRLALVDIDLTQRAYSTPQSVKLTRTRDPMPRPGPRTWYPTQGQGQQQLLTRSHESYGFVISAKEVMFSTAFVCLLAVLRKNRCSLLLQWPHQRRW